MFGRTFFEDNSNRRDFLSMLRTVLDSLFADGSGERTTSDCNLTFPHAELMSISELARTPHERSPHRARRGYGRRRV